MVWFGMVCYSVAWYDRELYDIRWYGMVWYCMVWYGMVGSIMLGDDNAAAKWESPASRRWSPDGQILFLGYHILSPDHDYLHD